MYVLERKKSGLEPFASFCLLARSHSHFNKNGEGKQIYFVEACYFLSPTMGGGLDGRQKKEEKPLFFKNIYV